MMLNMISSFYCTLLEMSLWLEHCSVAWLMMRYLELCPLNVICSLLKRCLQNAQNDVKRERQVQLVTQLFSNNNNNNTGDDIYSVLLYCKAKCKSSLGSH